MSQREKAKTACIIANIANHGVLKTQPTSGTTLNPIMEL